MDGVWWLRSAKLASLWKAWWSRYANAEFYLYNADDQYRLTQVFFFGLFLVVFIFFYFFIFVWLLCFFMKFLSFAGISSTGPSCFYCIEFFSGPLPTITIIPNIITIITIVIVYYHHCDSILSSQSLSDLSSLVVVAWL